MQLKRCSGPGASHADCEMLLQRLYVGHTGDSGAVMACTAGDLDFPLRLTMDHKPNRPDEKERIERSGGVVDEKRNRVVSMPKKETNRVTMLNMSRCDPSHPCNHDTAPQACSQATV